MVDETIPRRDFLKGAVVGTAAFATGGPAAAQPTAPAASAAPANEPKPPLTLTATEYAFIVAAVDTIIPADESRTPSGSPMRRGDLRRSPACRRYRDGGAALPRSPLPQGQARTRLSASCPQSARVFPLPESKQANAWTRKTFGKEFDRLSDPEREAALKAMEDGKATFEGFGSRMFFDALLQITMEGFFADPIYGGNRDMAAWKMVGYPGLPATYREEIKTYFGRKYDKPPRSIADFS